MSLRLHRLVSCALIAGFVCSSLVRLGAAAGEGAKGLAFSIVSGGGIAARVRVERVYRDRQTRGFFKIGVLPKWVAEGVEIRCGEARHLSEVLGSARGLVPSGSAQGAMEFHRISISIAEDSVPRLSAGRVQFKGTDCWDLKQGVRWVLRTGNWEHRRSRLP